MLFKLILFLSFYLPFQLALNPTKGVDLASIRLLIIGIFFLWLFEGLRSQKVIIKNNIQTGLVGAFLFFSIFSIFFAQNIDWSIRKLVYLLSVFPIYFVAIEVINRPERMKKIIQALVFSGTVASILGIFQFFLQFILGINETSKIWSSYIIRPFLGNSFSEMVLAYPSWLVNIAGNNYLRATSIFPDPHMFSFFLGLLLPLSIGMVFMDKKRSWFLTTFFIALADLLTFSRGGYLGLFAGLIFVSIIFWKKINKTHKKRFSLAVAIIFLMLIWPNPISNRFFSVFNSSEGSNLGRMEMWQKAGIVILEKPFFGVGLGNFPLEVRLSATYREPIYAHNTYLDIASESGIFAGFSWLLLLIVTIGRFIKRTKENPIYFYLATSLIIFSTHSLVDTGIYSPVVLTLFLIIISLAYANESEKMA